MSPYAVIADHIAKKVAYTKAKSIEDLQAAGVRINTVGLLAHEINKYLSTCSILNTTISTSSTTIITLNNDDNNEAIGTNNFIQNSNTNTNHNNNTSSSSSSSGIVTDTLLILPTGNWKPTSKWIHAVYKGIICMYLYGYTYNSYYIFMYHNFLHNLHVIYKQIKVFIHEI